MCNSSLLSIRGRKKSGEELSYEVLQHFAATTKGFYQQLAKAIHVPVRRREDVVPPPPSMAMQAAAVGLSVVLRDNLASFYSHVRTGGTLSFQDPPFKYKPSNI